SDHRTSMVDVALASSAAPSYFPVHRSVDGIALVDGGMWANNPAAVAAVEAISVMEWNPRDTHLLSVGCTGPALDICGCSRVGSGKLYWANNLAELFLAAQSSGSLGMAKLLLGGCNTHRITETVPAGVFELDSADRIADLNGLGASRARQEFHSLRDVFF